VKVKSGWATAAVLMAGLLSGVGDSTAENFSGLCLDNLEEGCQERFLPFDGDSIDFCEQTCQLTNPTPVRDLDATLYDFVCRGDNGADSDSRVIVLRQKDWDGKTTTSFIDGYETRTIVPCPGAAQGAEP
jgi:hypothetical protein